MIRRTMLCIFVVISIHGSEEEKHGYSHSVEFTDFTINISGLPDTYERVSRPPTPIRNEPVVQSYEDMVHRHHHQLRRSKFKTKVAAITAIVTTLITGGITLYIALRKCE